ncbi:MAG: hypothetical protein IJ833_10825 [Lachnospiraceae bacterium]|nr:hypothetical protein [Lachnospiraceae bacterium]
MRKHINPGILMLLVLCIFLSAVYHGLHQRSYMWDECTKQEIPVISVSAPMSANRDSKPEELSGMASRLTALQTTEQSFRLPMLLLLCCAVIVTAAIRGYSDYYRSHIMCRNSGFYSASTILCYIFRKDGKK